MNLKGIQRSIAAYLLVSGIASAADGKISLTGGYFALNAKAGGASTSISNPSAFRIAYQYPVMEKFELVAGYSILLADFAGTDLGYGLDLGANYYPFTLSHDDIVKDPVFDVKRIEKYSPYVGLGFYQRQFQSVKNSYAGLGFTAGTEKYYTNKINLKLEGRYVNLGGSGESTATEMSFMFGIAYKL